MRATNPFIIFSFIGQSLLAQPSPSGLASTGAGVRSPSLTFFDHIGYEQGLPNFHINALHLDCRGFLWIGTNGGLCRFDGHEMKVYRHNDADSTTIHADEIASLLEDEDGNFWVGLVNGGIACFNPANGRFQNFTLENGRHFAYHNNFLAQDTVGGIWVASHNGFGYFDAAQQRFVKHPASPDGAFSRSFFDKNNLFWIGGYRGLRRFDPKTGSLETFRLHPEIPEPTEANITSVQLDQQGNIWSGSWGEGLLRFDPLRWRFEQFRWKPKVNAPEYENICYHVAETFDFAGNRSFWVATEYDLIKMPLAPAEFPSSSTPFEVLSDQPETGLLRVPYRCLHPDYEGNLWAGSSGHGVYRHNTRQANFQFVQLDQPTSWLTFARGGDVLATAFEGIVTYDQQLRRKPVSPRFPRNLSHKGRQVWDMVEGGQDGVFYAGTLDGLLVFDAKTGRTRRFGHRAGDSTGLFNAKPVCLFSLGGERLLIGFWRGAFQVFDAKTGKSLKTLGSPHNIPVRIERTGDGTVWVCADGLLAVFDEEKWELETLLDERFEDVHLDRKGQIWLASMTGLVLFDRKKRQRLRKFTIHDGLPDNDVSAILEDSLGRLWLSTGLGICLFEPSRQKFHLLGKSDGFIFDKTGQTMQQSPDGRIWLVHHDKLLIFRPELVPTPQPSKCYLTGLRINGRDTLPAIFFEKMGEIRLRPGENALTFSYTAIDLATFGKTNFRYKLEGLQTEWVQAGKNRSAAFVNLPAGRYLFRVRPDDAGDDPAWDASLTVFVTDHFWQRAWFKWLLILLSLLAVGGASAYYLRSKITLREAELRGELAVEQTRRQIAQDIHDDLGADLSKISMAASLAAMLPGLSAETLREKMSDISAGAQEAARHLSDVVFLASPRFDAFSEVQAFFREQASQFFENHGDIELLFDCPPPPEGSADPPVPPEVKRHLYLIFKEVLNNIGKHARATQVSVQLHLFDGHFFQLKITDNGQGFDPGSPRHFGMGLTGLRLRAEKMGASLEIGSKIGQGTSIVLVGRI